MQNWFVLKSGLVTGPFTSENVLSNYTDQNVMVWGLNCNEWLNFSEWQTQLQNGAFNTEDQSAKIFIKPVKNSNPESDAKVFKIRPMTTPEQDEMTNVDSDVKSMEVSNSSNKDNVVEFKNPSSSSKNLSDYEKTAIAPLPTLPMVDDIFAANDNPNSENNDDQMPEDQITQLDGQLKDLLTEDDFGSDGKTLVQATMEGMSDEVMTHDGATQVQGFDMSSLQDETASAASDGATQVQGFDMSSLQAETASAASDGATQVQGFDMSSLEDALSEPANDSSAEVQSFDMNSIEDESSVLSSEQTLDSSLDQIHDQYTDGATQVQSFDINSLDENSNLKEDFNSQDDQSSYPDLAHATLPDINQIMEADSLGEMEMANNSRDDGSGPAEKTNIAELKDISQNIEQKKILEKPIWYVAYNGVSEGPMNVEVLLKKLDAFEHKDFIYLWKKGFPDWQNLFDTPQISSQLGIGFRRHDRFPFSGTVKIEFNGNIQIGQLENLSASGLGATGFGPLVLGEKVKVTLDCPDLDQEVEFTAMIRFTSDLGVLGLSFVLAEYAENVNKVIELVKSASKSQKAA